MSCSLTVSPDIEPINLQLGPCLNTTATTQLENILCSLEFLYNNFRNWTITLNCRCWCRNSFILSSINSVYCWAKRRNEVIVSFLYSHHSITFPENRDVLLLFLSHFHLIYHLIFVWYGRDRRPLPGYEQYHCLLHINILNITNTYTANVSWKQFVFIFLCKFLVFIESSALL